MPYGTPRTLMPIFDELRGQRVVVRPYRETDAPDLQAAVEESREHVRPWLPFADEHQTVDESRDWIIRCMARWMLREDFIVGLWDAATGGYLGGSGLHPRDWQVPSFEIGYWLRASAQGHGYMREAVQLLTDHAFDHLSAQRVMIRCDARNARSAAVAERLGFHREAYLRHDSIANDGTVRDTLIFSLIPTDPRWPS
jgi:RimJ/RimL family protein N-acetyltransferase